MTSDVVRRNGYEIGRRTPRSDELLRGVVVVYELQDVARGETTFVEDRRVLPGHYARVCRCGRLSCEHIEILAQVYPFVDHDPPPAAA